MIGTAIKFRLNTEASLEQARLCIRNLTALQVPGAADAILSWMEQTPDTNEIEKVQIMFPAVGKVATAQDVPRMKRFLEMIGPKWKESDVDWESDWKAMIQALEQHKQIESDLIDRWAMKALSIE